MNPTPPGGARYHMRFFFDPGSGTCLWSANDAARRDFGYAVSVDDLPLHPATAAALDELVVRFDAGVDWSYPPDSPIWTATEEARFWSDAAALVERVREELGADFHIEHPRAR